MKKPYQISFSGGRTSGYLTWYLLENFSHLYDFIVTFANTGIEHEKTLEFVRNCDKHFGFNTVWLEPVINPTKRVGTTHKIVTFETATRGTHLFESMIEKYGIPNKVFRHCTRELKIRPMDSYIRSLGLMPKQIPTAIGIRADESRRCANDAEQKNFVYPLVTDHPVDKNFILEWWSKQDFDLDLEEWDGNCNMCFEKSFPKLLKQLETNPDALEFHLRMERIHGQTNNKPGMPGRVFFRQRKSANDVLEMSKQTRAA
ncbi:phosphoadenosine phosphosulfate reductase domain-containing protein [Acinetobacter colistiniresistens]|uniref:phosphoadenosine phosphosulfate reductase domain-containing protein n=1 Tax=Acinetobacter colistiniresistens TaxID=280145 RepID=UPI001250681A|nr:phosphoadenosine phosphosulfate reductase family protein [Acinetobacter colistiniresistens]